MKHLLRHLPQPIRRFLRGEDAAVIAEAVIVLPLLLWAYIGLFVYWDCFRSLNTVQKAAYTVSDMLSRQQTDIPTSYITGLHKVLEYLIDKDQNASMRVTSVYYSTANSDFEVHWSRTTNAAVFPEMTTASLQNYRSQIPTMTAGEYNVIVEVSVPYVPLFNVGLTNQTFTEFIPTRPRFLTCIVLDKIPCPVS